MLIILPIWTLKKNTKKCTHGSDYAMKSTITVKIFWDVLMFYLIFIQPQEKRNVIISNKYGKYELPHELPNGFRLRILGNNETSRKSQNFVEL